MHIQGHVDYRERRRYIHNDSVARSKRPIVISLSPQKAVLSLSLSLSSLLTRACISNRGALTYQTGCTHGQTVMEQVIIIST